VPLDSDEPHPFMFQVGLSGSQEKYVQYFEVRGDANDFANWEETGRKPTVSTTATKEAESQFSEIKKFINRIQTAFYMWLWRSFALKGAELRIRCYRHVYER